MGPNVKSRSLLIVAAIAAAVAAGIVTYWLTRPAAAPKQLILYGNVDLRQVDLAFNGSERIAAVQAQEGDVIHKGQVLARLDTTRLEPAFAQAKAQMLAQKAAVARLHNGSRPEEIAQARANLASAKADADNARRIYERETALFAKGTASQQDLDNAKATTDVAGAKVEVNQKALDLEIAGPRAEDVAQAEAQLRANQAQVALARQQLADADLIAPVDGVIRSRLMEPGDMASPQRPVFSIAIVDPKWVRAYVSETDLGRIRPGMTASVMVDAFPERRIPGRIGFISPVAEFTPKTVQTEELRTSLVYEVRIFVKDDADVLRLGMPATVYVPLDQNQPPPSPAGAPQPDGAAKP
jgi:HlyD family secretion protein